MEDLTMVITEEIKQQVWSKGRVCENYSSDKVRKDACGAFIVFDKFGDRSSAFGWEIDHIIPKSFFGSHPRITEEQIDDLKNLRPLNWQNNASKADNYPFYSSACTASEDGTRNVEKSEGKVVNEAVQIELKKYFNLET